MSKKPKSELSGLKLDKERYVALLTKLMAESEGLQNNPAQGLYPKEDDALQLILYACPRLEHNIMYMKW